MLAPNSDKIKLQQPNCGKPSPLAKQVVRIAPSMLLSAFSTSLARVSAGARAKDGG